MSIAEVQAVDRDCGLSTAETVFCFAFLHQKSLSHLFTQYTTTTISTKSHLQISITMHLHHC